MGLVKTRRLAAMHPPSPRLRRTGKRQRTKFGKRKVVVKVKMGVKNHTGFSRGMK